MKNLNITLTDEQFNAFVDVVVNLLSTHTEIEEEVQQEESPEEPFELDFSYLSDKTINLMEQFRVLNKWIDTKSEEYINLRDEYHCPNFLATVRILVERKMAEVIKNESGRITAFKITY